MKKRKIDVINICSVYSCDKKVNGRGLCQKHYDKARWDGTLKNLYQKKSFSKETPLKERKDHLKEKTMLNPITGCWEWNGALSYGGYGTYKIHGLKTYRVHRLFYEIFVSEIPNGMQINHKCNNRICCNPSHLYCGTQKENVRDRDLAGRSYYPKGSNKVQSKLKDNEVLKIRELLKQGKTCLSVAKDFMVSREAISNIKHGRTWSHL